MSESLIALRSSLAMAPWRPLRTTLVRCVALAPLTEAGSPDYLFTSGRANRFNPPGVQCVYFSEDERTARAEYARRFGNSVAALQPLGTFFAEISLEKALDLADQQTRSILGLKDRDMSASWYGSRRLVRTQLLGLAVSQQTQISAIRYPSDAALATGFSGFNVVVFHDCVRRPDFVHILGPTKKPLQKWP